MRLMKLAIGGCFTVLASAYLWLDPAFNAQYGLYWFLLFGFATMTVWSFFTYRSARIRKAFNALTMHSKDTDSWGQNPQLFTSAKKG
jgi:CDP-diglyceride synthetase